jgi:hypothetical protein
MSVVVIVASLIIWSPVLAQLRLLKLVISVAVTYLLVHSNKSSVSKTTTHVAQFTLSTAQPHDGTCQDDVPSQSSLRNLVHHVSHVDNILVHSGVQAHAVSSTYFLVAGS